MNDRGRSCAVWLAWGVLGAVCLPGAASAQDPDSKQETPEEARRSREHLRTLSIEELLEVRVSTPSRKDQPLSSVPAAIYVLHGDDLRRMGVQSIPEVLRAVPGVNVASIDGSIWAVSIRGFNLQFANKLQVLVDGRSVYTNLFSGVYWDTMDTLIEDIERIEVIRGPGAAQWGANSVNGVINIITKKAEDTQGGIATVGTGSELEGFTAARYGGRAGEDLHYRVYAKYFTRDEQHKANDSWAQGRAGLRLDWSPEEDDDFSLQGEYYDGVSHHQRTAIMLAAPFTSLFVDHEDVSGGHLVGRWDRRLSEESSLRLQLNYTHAEREQTILEQTHDTFSVDFDHRFPLFEGHDIVWGAGYRVVADEFDNTFTIQMDPDSELRHLVSAFVQDEIEILPDELSFMIGSKFEYNSHTQFEVQPTARLHWQLDPRHSVWAAASRAVRTPSRGNDDIRINFNATPAPALLAITGNRDVESEEALSFEVGYRSQPVDSLIVDVAAFWTEYDDLITSAPGVPFFETTPAPPHLVLTFPSQNVLDGRTYGVEATATLRVMEDWRLSGAYTFLRMHLNEINDTLVLPDDEAFEGSSPRHQVFLRSSWDFLEDFELDVMARFVDVLPAQDVDSYVQAAARLGWHATDTLELAVTGQNLMRGKHEEFGNATDGSVATEQERAVFFSVLFRF